MIRVAYVHDDKKDFSCHDFYCLRVDFQHFLCLTDFGELPAGDSKKTMLFTHGFSFSLLGSVKYMDMFRKRGFNILMYDHRHHGKSGGDNVTFGITERDDLKAVAGWAKEKTGPTTVIGIHGESIGAAVALQYAAIDNQAIFFIHGGADTYIPTEMGRRLYRVYMGKKRIYICPGAKHSDSFWTDKKEYDRQIGEFLREIGVH